MAANPPGVARLDLLIIAYRPTHAELQALAACLAALAPGIRYSFALNAAPTPLPPGLEPLLAGALLVQHNAENLGYGRAANQLFQALRGEPQALRDGKHVLQLIRLSRLVIHRVAGAFHCHRQRTGGSRGKVDLWVCPSQPGGQFPPGFLSDPLGITAEHAG
ncbi:MAG: hypothetical protein EBS53_04295, partial [Bacteroidetes bacterium]|nr:hypothetical protein [Bacteroidota bacterium]